MLLLLYGGRGWIGKQFVEILKSQNIDYHISNLRVDKTEEITKEIEKLKPTHLISFIGRTHGEEFSTIDYLEKKEKFMRMLEIIFFLL